MQQPMVLNVNQQRETGRKAQLGNIQAAKSVADIIRSTLGPRAMLKMLLDPMGIVMTNDGNSIIRNVNVSHPAAKSMLELSRTQDEEVGDGTTSVLILAGEMLSGATDFFERNIHPTIICKGYMKALEDAEAIMQDISIAVDQDDHALVAQIVDSAVGTKFSGRYGALFRDLAIKAVNMVADPQPDGSVEIDIKRYARIERIAGGDLEDSHVLNGVMINKYPLHHDMARRVENPRVLLMDCPMEYKKGESQTDVELTNEEDYKKMLDMEQNAIKQMCDNIIAVKPDIVITEKGCSDLAIHYMLKAGIVTMRRLRKTDSNRVAKVTGATIINSTDEILESDVGTQCKLFYSEKVTSEEWYSFFVECEDPKACTIIVRGGTKDTQPAVGPKLNDAMQVAKTIIASPSLLPGGGATEMAVAQGLRERGKAIEGVQQVPYLAVAEALEVIPRTLAENCGATVIRLITQLRAKHANREGHTWGIDGNKGVLADMQELGIWEPALVKSQSIKTAIESACMLLRIDDIHSGIAHKGGSGEQQPQQGGEVQQEEGHQN
jgi:T-complex protein 1 subunit gamma